MPPSGVALLARGCVTARDGATASGSNSLARRRVSTPRATRASPFVVVRVKVCRSYAVTLTLSLS